jgi:redox-sensitive bicupin YhaK (pirin superfamily)
MLPDQKTTDRRETMSQVNGLQSTSARTVSRVIKGLPATDGAGVELTRVIAQPALPMIDPFLLLDVFRSDRPGDYIAGFPPHPHRGFETVTYLLAGRMRHKDSAGHEGVIEPGGVQWMTAARGIVHSEMPEQQEGLLAGFQLWVNLPAAHKMDPPAYQEFAADAIPVEQRADGATIRVIAGETAGGVVGPVSQPLTRPRYFDVDLAPGAAFEESLPATHNAFVFIISGELLAADAEDVETPIRPDELAVLSHGDRFTAQATEQGARFLLIAGMPLNEPVARGGPFVMNTREQIHQAQADYEAGRL